MLKEATSYYVHNGSSVLCTLLDVIKAFDRVESVKFFTLLVVMMDVLNKHNEVRLMTSCVFFGSLAKLRRLTSYYIGIFVLLGVEVLNE